MPPAPPPLPRARAQGGGPQSCPAQTDDSSLRFGLWPWSDLGASHLAPFQDPNEGCSGRVQASGGVRRPQQKPETSCWRSSSSPPPAGAAMAEEAWTKPAVPAATFESNLAPAQGTPAGSVGMPMDAVVSVPPPPPPQGMARAGLQGARCGLATWPGHTWPPRADCEPCLGPALLPAPPSTPRSLLLPALPSTPRSLLLPTRPPALRPRGLAPQPLIDAVTAGLLASCNHFVIQQRVKVAEAMTMGCYQVSSGMTTRRHAAASGGGEGADAPATSKRTRTTSSTGTRTRRSSRSRRSRTTARGAAAVSPPGGAERARGADRRRTPRKRPETPKRRATPCSLPSSA